MTRFAATAGRFDRRVIAAIAVVVVALAAIVSVMVARRSDHGAPPWLGDRATCRTAATTHVHDPKRLTLLNACATYSGTVRSVDQVAAYNDLKITLVPDANLRSYLRESNQGVVVVDVIATDVPTVTAPPVGSRITAWGAWMLDKATRSTQLLPAYRIVVDKADPNAPVLRGESVEKHAPPIQRTLKLQIKTADRVVVGGRINVPIEAKWLQGGQLIPASQVRLFAEITDGAGVGIRWKATMTDTRGQAVLQMVALQVPEAYTLTLYSATPGQAASTTAPVQVAKA